MMRLSVPIHSDKQQHIPLVVKTSFADFGGSSDAQETGNSCANFMRGGNAPASRITGAVDYH
jgi:hypothetical protein